MGQPNSKFEELARDAAENVQAAREAGEQLMLLPDEPATGESERAKRGKGKATSQLREFLAARGLRMPEDVLVEMAGMASGEDAFLTAMARAEQVLLWAQEGAVGSQGAPSAPSMAKRLETFQFIFTAQLRALDALLPYGLAKVTPDVQPTVVVPVVVPAAPSQGIEQGRPMRDITPAQPGRMVPMGLAMQIQQNQQVSATVSRQSDSESRTE